MKHLRKYNESLEKKDEMIEYIKLCFIEFYDKLGEKGVFTEELNDGKSITFEMVIDLPELDNYSNIGEFIKHGEEITEFYKEIEYCLEKVLSKYNIKIKFEYEFPPEGNIRIIFVLKGSGKKKFV